MARIAALTLFLTAVAIVACGPASHNENGRGGDGGSGTGTGSGSCVDEDGDGWTTCQNDCCDNASQCANPALVNPGALEVNGDGVDNDCDGHIDNAILSCDQNVTGNSTSGYDYASAIDVCPTTQLQGSALMADPLRHWGIIDAELTLADGTATPNSKSMAILPHYGSGVMPKNGAKLMLMSTGFAAGEGDPNYHSALSAIMGTVSKFPADYAQAHNGTLPNAPGCPNPGGVHANDPTMLTLKIRVPTNAQSFSMDINFFSTEFPKWTCSAYSDFFVVLLDSTYSGSGSNANPADKNLAFYRNMAGSDYPVGVNLAYGNTGLFTECVNGSTGCEPGCTGGTISTCTSTAELQGTGLEQSDQGKCDNDSLTGGGTGWLTTSGNVTPGEIMTLRIALWDTSDDIYDSMAVIDNFAWSALTSQPGTVIQRRGPDTPLHDPIYIPVHASGNASYLE
jgi:hypothetical protein